MSDTRIFGHMVTYNEMDRYLQRTIPWLASFVDEVFVFDDRSEDGTYEFAEKVGCQVDRRRYSNPSFLENEGKFRGGAWQRMEERLKPTTDDWVLCIDADEFLLPGYTEASFIRDALDMVVTQARLTGRQSIAFTVAEIFEFDKGGWPQQRVDGYWGTIRACRLVSWRPGAYFLGRNSTGSVPGPWDHGYDPVPGLQIAHLGYVRPEDREEKAKRYLASDGHNIQHVLSIVDTPVLEAWNGPESCAKVLHAG